VTYMNVVIPTFNEEDNIACVLTALSWQSVQPDRVMVIDGASSDATREIVSRFPGVEFVECERGVGRQRQKGLELADKGVVVFLDADTSPHPLFLERLSVQMKRRCLKAACPLFVSESSSPAVRAVYLLFDAVFCALQGILPSGGGMCIAVDRDVALKAGGFRADLTYEDIEFIRRVGRRARFGMVLTTLSVSDRRFREEGFLPTLLKYLLLSFLFSLGAFRAANRVPYHFARYRTSGGESVELVDSESRPVGTGRKSEVHHSETPLHRAFSVYLFDGSGRVLMQQRSAGKKTWPLVWSNSVCGHPSPGERTEVSAARRVRYEMGLAVRRLEVVLPTYRYRAEFAGVVENELCPVLVGLVNGDPRPNPREVADWDWVPWSDLVERARVRPDTLSPWCSEQVGLLDASGRIPLNAKASLVS